MHLDPVEGREKRGHEEVAVIEEKSSYLLFVRPWLFSMSLIDWLLMYHGSGVDVLHEAGGKGYYHEEMG